MITGKCTRCGRALRRVFIVNGQAYGPICVFKIAPDFVVEKPASKRKPKSFEEALIEDQQLSIFSEQEEASGLRETQQ